MSERAHTETERDHAGLYQGAERMADAGSIGSISGSVGRTQAAGRIGNAEARQAAPSDDAARLRAADSVMLSPEARAAAEADGAKPLRADLVERVRGELEARTYFSDEKLDIAVDRLIDDITNG